MILSKSNVVHYLLEQGLLALESVVDGDLMVVDVTYGQDSISVSTPRELFTIPPSPIPVSSPYDTLDGQRFLVLAPVTPANHPMQVIDNWTALIKP